MDALGTIIRQQRKAVSLTLQKLATMSGVSASHLARIEAGERFPSARVLKKIAVHLGYEDDELFTLAGYLSGPSHRVEEKGSSYKGKLAPDVASALAREPVKVQREVIKILAMLKSVATDMSQEKSKKGK
ncbi:MAG: helix-turn-helix transcriptional regulator [Chloroflexi bacterium]|nr:helix-turn-helix transcriptional regulator [Chloroflexota bacterium]